MKTQHYVAIYMRSRTPPERLQCKSLLAFEASPAAALLKALDIAARADRVCLWTWDPEQRRLVQRL